MTRSGRHEGGRTETLLAPTSLPARPGAGAGSGDLATDGHQGVDDLGVRVVEPHVARGQRRVEVDRGAAGALVDIGDPGVSRAATVRDEQVHGELGRGCGHRRVDPTLEALGRLGREPVPPRRAGDRDRVEVGCLDEHLGRRGRDLGRGPSHDAGDGERAVQAVDDHQVLRIQGAGHVVQGGELLPHPGPAGADPTRERAQVERVQRLPEQHHHVVGDVDGQRDGAHAQLGEPRGHPRRRGRRGVDPAHDAGDVAVAPGHAVDRPLVGDGHGIPVGVGRSHVEVRGVAEGHAGRQGVLPGDPPQGEAVAAVRGDVDLDDLVAEAEQLDRVVTGGQDSRGLLAQELGQHDDAVVVLAEAELESGADHAVGDVAVGLAGRDLEPPGQDPTGQDADDEVTGDEVVRSADDLLGLALGDLLAVLAHVHGAPVDGLAVLLRLRLHGQDATDDEGAAEVATTSPLLLEPDPHQGSGDVGTGGVGRHVGQLTKPGHGRVHQISIPNWREKRTSPSTMSCMSPTPCRSISERSMPRPNANPE